MSTTLAAADTIYLAVPTFDILGPQLTALVKGVFGVAFIAVLVMLFIKKEWGPMVGVFVAGSIVAYFIYVPDAMLKLSNFASTFM